MEMKILISFIMAIPVLTRASCPCSSALQFGSTVTPNTLLQNLLSASCNKPLQVIQLTKPTCDTFKQMQIIPNSLYSKQACSLPMAKQVPIMSNPTISIEVLSNRPSAPVVQAIASPSCSFSPAASLPNYPLTTSCSLPPSPAIPSYPITSTCPMPSPAPLINPFLPAASPVSALAPPVSNLLPPIRPTQTRCQHLRKIPIPPPTL